MASVGHDATRRACRPLEGAAADERQAYSERVDEIKAA